MTGARIAAAALAGVIAWIGLAAAPARAGGGCDRSAVTIIGDAEEEQEARAAVDQARAYFAALGLFVDLRLSIRFQQVVIVAPADSGRSFGEAPVSGYYHAGAKEVRITSTNSDWARRRQPWRLAWSRELAYSILRHEIAHAIIYQLLGESHRKLPRAWHEALAYIVQLDLMDASLRQSVLAQYPERRAFDSTLHINDFVYGADPDGFAIAAYKTYLRDGGREFLKRALRFELEMIDLSELP